MVANRELLSCTHEAEKEMPVPEANRTLVIQSVADSSTLNRSYVAGGTPTIGAIFLPRACLSAIKPNCHNTLFELPYT
jgi:hypothetical protein